MSNFVNQTFGNGKADVSGSLVCVYIHNVAYLFSFHLLYISPLVANTMYVAIHKVGVVKY